MSLKVKLGQNLIIELEDCIYKGTYESGTSDRIDMIDVRKYPCGEPIPSNFSFYKYEILDVKVLDTDSDSNNEENTNQNGYIKIKQVVYKRLEQALKEHTYLCNADKRYYDLMELIKDSTLCSIIGLSNQPGRLSKLSLIVIGVCNKLYIIDIKEFKQRKMPKELKDILESDWIKKITFSGKWFADSLHHCHDIKRLTNVFDIKVVDTYIQNTTLKSQKTISRSLGDCLLYHLNLPKSILDMDTDDLHKLNWDERPLSTEMVNVALQHCVYLNTLKDYLENLIMSDIYKEVMMEYRNLITDKASMQFQETDRTAIDDSEEF